MAKGDFSLNHHDVAARLRRLSAAQAEALEQALETISRTGSRAAGDIGNHGDLPLFLLPLAEAGLSAPQVVRLLESMPPDFRLDHREIYYDFRLARWLRHLEPPTLAQCFEEYLESAENPEEGLAYLRKEWSAFLRRHETG